LKKGPNIFRNINIEEGPNIFRNINIEEGPNIFRNINIEEGPNIFRNIDIEEGPKTYSENLSQLRAGANPVAQFFKQKSSTDQPTSLSAWCRAS
jgi:hypothetical protein